MGVETINLEVESTDDAVKAVVGSGGFVIGSPTLGGHMPTQVGSLCCGCGAIMAVPGSWRAHANVGGEACAALGGLKQNPAAKISALAGSGHCIADQ